MWTACDGGTATETMGIQEGMKRQNAILRMCRGEANLRDGLSKETAKTQLERFVAMDVYGVLKMTKT